MANTNMTKYSEIAGKIRLIPAEKNMPSYEWEELVLKLCDSNDSRLHEIGIRELGEIGFNRFESGKKLV